MISKLLSILFLLQATILLGQSNPTAFDLSTDNFSMKQWNDSAVAGTYPANMIFHMSNKLEDSVFVATSNYTCPYYLTTDSRINGNDTLGFSFFNASTYLSDACLDTGKTTVKKFAGAAVLTVNATNRENIQVSWTGRMLSKLTFNDTSKTGQTRFYAIKLQYRTDSTQKFVDLPNAIKFNCNSDSVTYKTENTAEIIPAEALPNTCNNQSFIQLRWLYHLSKNAKGKRPELGVDDIKVTSDFFTTIIKNETSKTIKAYPNPSSNHIISLSKNSSGEVISVIGTSVLNFSNSNKIDLSNSPAGVYFIRTSKGESVKVILE